MAVQKREPGEPGSKPISIKRTLSLPTQRTSPPIGIESYTIFIFGQQKIGKTSFTTQFDGVLHIMFEPSGKDYSLWQIEPRDWEEFKDFIELLKEKKREGTLEYKTFALDTIDLCFSMCSDYVCTKAGVDHPSDGGFGKLHKELEVEFRDTILDLSRLGGFIAVSHDKEKTIKSRKGREYTILTSSAGSACNKIMAKFCDIIGYYYVDDNGDRVLQIRPDEEVECGNRLDSKFKYTNGKEIINIPMGKSAVEAHSNFIKAFNNQLIEQSTESQSLIKIKKGA